MSYLLICFERRQLFTQNNFFFPAAATTFDICKSLAQSAATTNSIRIVSLLAPSPEIAALFDEMILIDEGKIIYSGPVNETLSYFSSLGYEMPERIDPGEWLLVSVFHRGYSVAF